MSTKLQVQAQTTQLNNMAVNLDLLRDVNKTIPKQLVVDNPSPFEEQLPILDTWLTSNDCLAEGANFKLCYAQTRLKLIEATYALDNANDLVYGSQVTIKGLMNTINTVVDQAQGSATMFDPLSLLKLKEK